MGNVCAPDKKTEDKSDKEMNTKVKDITVFTFAGPQDYFDAAETPPTFSDPLFFSQNKSIDMTSCSKDQSVAS